MTDPFLQALTGPSVLPQSVHDLHRSQGEYVGECDIERGRDTLIQLALRLGRFRLDVAASIPGLEGDPLPRPAHAAFTKKLAG